MPSLVTINPSGDTTGATDATAINAAFSPADRDTIVQLGPGHWYSNDVLTVPHGNELRGSGAGMNGHTSTDPSGTVIHPVAAFAGGEVIGLPAGNEGNRIRELSILNDLGTPPDVDGIVLHGGVNGTLISHVSVALVTGHGIACYQEDGHDADGLWMDRVMIQRPGLNGVHRPPSDANIHCVHIQYAGQAGDDVYRHGFYTTPNSSGNMCYVACRADLCVGSGWVIDHKGSFGDATKLTGCSTERNGESGCLVTNSSAGGDDWRAPVIISGCCFEGDGTGIGPGGTTGTGTGGRYGGIEVRGRNRVFVDGTVIAVSTTDVDAGAPKHSLIIRQVAGTDVESVVWTGGRMNYSTGQGGAAILNHSLCDHLQIGSATQQAGGFRSTSPKDRTGRATLNGTSVTVSTPWAWPSMLVNLTPLGAPSGQLYVSSRRNGSFVVSSTARESSLSLAWQILPGQ